MKKLKIAGVAILAIGVGVWKAIDTKAIKRGKDVVKEGSELIMEKKGSKVAVSKTTKLLADWKNVKVPYRQLKVTTKEGVKLMKFPVFENFTVHSFKLPKNLWKAKDSQQFSYGLSSFRKQLKSSPDEVKKILNSQNMQMLKRDEIYFNANKKEILLAEKRMLKAVQSGDDKLISKEYKALKKITNQINFISLKKGEKFSLFKDPEEILQRQIKDINNEKSTGKVYGYIWHHKETEGVMELVAKDVHEFNRHTGGNSLWSMGIR